MTTSNANKAVELEETISIKDFQDLIAKTKDKARVGQVTFDERNVLILHFMSLAILAIPALKEAYDSVKALDFHKELKKDVKASKGNRTRQIMLENIGKILALSTQTFTQLENLFDNEENTNATLNALDSTRDALDAILRMPFPKRSTILELIKEYEESDGSVINQKNHEGMEDLLKMYADANIKSEFINHCKSYFKHK